MWSKFPFGGAQPPLPPCSPCSYLAGIDSSAIASFFALARAWHTKNVVKAFPSFAPVRKIPGSATVKQPIAIFGGYSLISIKSSLEDFCC